MASAATPAIKPVEAPWRAEALDLVRATSGGLLFGIPLLFTMEVWWTGTLTASWALLLLIVVLYVPVLLMNKTAGFRATRDVRWRDAAADAVEAVALALVITTAMLVLIREINPDTPLGAGLGKVLYESVPFCLGVGVARHLMGGGTSSDSEAAAGREDDSPTTGGSTVGDLGAALVGAVFVALSIAPTDEIPMIASALTPVWVLALMAASLVVSYAIVFVAGFSNQERRQQQQGALQRPITETAVCYLIALLAAFALLWMFQRGMRPWPDLLTQTVVLGLPAAVGGAAGRLAI